MKKPSRPPSSLGPAFIEADEVPQEAPLSPAEAEAYSLLRTIARFYCTQAEDVIPTNPETIFTRLERGVGYYLAFMPFDADNPAHPSDSTDDVNDDIYAGLRMMAGDLGLYSRGGIDVMDFDDAIIIRCQRLTDLLNMCGTVLQEESCPGGTDAKQSLLEKLKLIRAQTEGDKEATPLKGRTFEGPLN